MSDFITATTRRTPDPTKRVNYSFGLVLGVDEFVDEQGYFLAKHRQHNHLLHGFGAVKGLHVSVIDTADGPEVQVTPGVAINPRGQTICVPRVMCAKLADWVEAHLAAIQAETGFIPPGELALLVTLCYAECPTDIVPVPGEPCRTQEDAQAPSRLQDSFELKLCLNQEQPVPSLIPGPGSLPNGSSGGSKLCYRPEESYEIAVRQLGEFLSSIQVTDAVPVSATDEEVAEALVEFFNPTSLPSLPGGGLLVRHEDARRRFRTALRMWVSRVRPSLPDEPASACDTPKDTCVVLAEVRLDVAAGGGIAPGSVVVSNAQSPFLVETRVLEELLLRQFIGGAGLGPASSLPGGEAVALVAAGQFVFDGAGNPSPAGLMYNGLQAQLLSVSGQLRQYLLTWTGPPPYQNPELPGAQHTYMVQGNVQIDLSNNVIQVLNFEAFQNAGIVVQVRRGNGMMVEVKQIGVVT